MSQASEYAANVSRILQQKADAQAQGHLQRGQILGQTIATLGQVIPQQVQQAMKLGAEKRKKEQIEGIFKKYPGDLDSAIQEIMPIDQKLGTELMDRNVQAQKLAFEYKKAKRDAELVDREFIANNLGAATDQDSHTQALLTLQHGGFDISKFNPQFDPKAAQQYQLSALSPEKRYEVTHPAPPKPPEPFTLSEGQTRFGPDGQPLANVPKPPGSQEGGFTLSPGGRRYDAQGKLIAQAPNAPTQAGEGSKRWAKDPTTGDVRLMTDAEVMRIGATQPDTADMRNKGAQKAATQRGIAKVREIGAPLFARIGPAQRANALKRGVEAVFGSDPQFRTYQDARLATAGALAVEQQGSRVSDADVKALWAPLIPDPYSDTKESWDLKWEVIDAMRGIDPSKAAPQTPQAQTGPKVGEQRTINGVPAKWDGKGWLPVRK